MSDLMWKEFEAWTANHDYLGGVELDRTISGNYADIDMQHAWQSWQASRECLVIDLPKPAGLDRMSSEMSIQEIREDNRFNRALELAKKALTAAGVKYK